MSALDVSVQAQILNLLEDMKQRYGLTLVFIAHDLAVVKNVSDRVLVMYLGKMCEVGAPEDLFASPSHPYTGALLAAIPVPDPSVRPDEEHVLGGEVPSPIHPPSGCRFRTRCPKAQERCANEEPTLREVAPNHYVACHFPLEPGELIDFTASGSARPSSRPRTGTARAPRSGGLRLLDREQRPVEHLGDVVHQDELELVADRGGHVVQVRPVAGREDDRRQPCPLRPGPSASRHRSAARVPAA